VPFGQLEMRTFGVPPETIQENPAKGYFLPGFALCAFIYTISKEHNSIRASFAQRAFLFIYLFNAIS